MKQQWTLKNTQALFKKPFFDLIFEAQKTHREYFNPNKIQISTLLSIKTGACPEDCKYCPQSARYKTNIKKEPLLELNQILKAAKEAKSAGSNRFCMGAAWKNPNNKDMPFLKKIITEVKKMGMETCMTLGSLNHDQAKTLSKAGLDFYNHNLDTSSNFYKNIVTTRTYEERLKTLEIVRNAGLKICSGGIIGLGENIQDRMDLLMTLSNLPYPPESIPINMLVKTPGIPLENAPNVDAFDFIRIIAATRIMIPKSYIRLSAGRKNMNEQMQAMCFMAGANSIFYGCKLLTTKNPEKEHDIKLFKKLNLYPDHKNNNSSKIDKKNFNLQVKTIHSTQYYNAAI